MDGDNEPAPPYAVIVRVHDRMVDLGVLLGLIRHRWQQGPAQLVVSSNGLSAGVAVPQDARELADCVVEHPHNTGCCLGTLRLIEEGLRVLDDEVAWIVLLEADTWVLDDAIVHQTIQQLGHSGRRWSSARWVEKRPSQALDFAILDRSLLADLPELFKPLPDHADAEGMIAHRLAEAGETPEWIRPAMPVHIPRVARRLFGSRFQGRYRSFPAVPMLTHHVEDLAGGMTEKLELANALTGGALFPEVPAGTPASRLRHRLLARLRRWIPRGAWIRPRRLSSTTRTTRTKSPARDRRVQSL